MRRYDDAVEVRTADRAERADAEPTGPEEFFWQGRLWQVRATLAQWVETGPWWTSPGVRAVVGPDDTSDETVDDDSSEAALLRVVSTSGRSRGGLATREPDLLSEPRAVAEVLAEREVWRVEAACPRDQALPVPSDEAPGSGVFDLVHTWTTGSWRLIACSD